MKTIYGALAVMLVCVGVAQGAFAADASIGVSGLTFTPADVTINAGDTVFWSDLAANHNVAQSASPASDVWDGAGFRSGAPSEFSTFQYTFNTPGIYYYLCEPHATVGMKGSVTVLPVGLPAADPVGLAIVAAALIGAAIVVLRRRPRGAGCAS